MELWRLQAQQRQRPSTDAGAGHLPGAGDRTLGLFSPDAAYNALHIGTCFVALAGRDHRTQPAHQAAQGSPTAAIRSRGGRVPRGVRRRSSAVALTGYQDARPCFIGRGTLAPEVSGPAGCATPPTRACSTPSIRSPACGCESSCPRTARPSCADGRRLCRRRDGGRRRDRPAPAPPSPILPSSRRSSSARGCSTAATRRGRRRPALRVFGRRQGAGHHETPRPWPT